MTMNSDEDSHVLHAVVVPFPAQGHVNALLNFAELLSTRGFFITFVNTEWSERRIFGDSQVFQRPNFRFLSVPDGLPAEHGRMAELGEYWGVLQKLGSELEQLLRSARDKSEIPPVTCIVSDAVMSCTHSVAANMEVPRVIFWPVCAAFSISHKYAPLLLSQGLIPVKVSEAKCPERLITTLPGNIPPLWPADLLTFSREQDASDPIFQASLYEARFADIGDYVLVNTFEELEGKDAVAALSANGCPAMAIGPVFLDNVLQGKKVKSSMWEEDESCLNWLEMHPPNSVLYVSFGSIAIKSQQQLEELALGLERSEQPFLWVLRSDLAQGESGVLPEGFKERTKARAFFVSWAPQLRVLSHPSVGGFLTHSGWNSTLESISTGVPMIGWPYYGDQFLNCRFAKDIWKVGLDFDDVDVDDLRLVRREEVETAVRRLMQSSEGMVLRMRALQLKEVATKAVMPGGSSFSNLDVFIHHMREKAKPRVS
uniref:Glycosyltransferase n=1 Tax=Wollemia nobilis TaxID=56998 RepID=A0A0C9RST7_9CONI